METRRVEATKGSEGYKDNININLAKEVVNIISERNRENDIFKYEELNRKADELSGELVEYLNEAYNGQFLTEFFLIPQIIEFNTDKEALNYFLYNSSIANKLKEYSREDIHKIGIIYAETNDEDHPYAFLYSLFIDEGSLDPDGKEEGLHIQRQRNWHPDELRMPPEFYSFLQRMGLTLRAASDLYELNSYSENIYYGFADLFEEIQGSWPRIIEKSKLLK